MKIRVSVRVPHGGGAQGGDDDGGIHEETVTQEIGWQQRLFSHTEVERALAHAQVGPNADLSGKWTNDINLKRATDAGWSGDTVCTYVGEDGYVDVSEIGQPMAGEREKVELARAVLEREGAPDLVEQVRSTSQSMHIFGSVQCIDRSWDTVLIGIIRASAGGRIDVRPDFSNKCGGKEYAVYTRTNEKVVYTLDVVEDGGGEESPFERTLLGDIKRRRAIFEAQRADCMLAVPPENPDAIRLFYRGEVASADLPDSEGVAVDYLVKLPPLWVLEGEPSCLGKSSQLARVSSSGLCHINLPLEFTAVALTQSAPLLEVVCHSFSARGARTVVGYGTAPLPLTRGSHSLDIECWRVGGTAVEELRTMFLDAGLEIQPEVPATAPTLEEPGPEAPVNLAALLTIPTGRVTVKIGLAMQGAKFAEHPEGGGHPLGQLGVVATRDQQTRLTSLFAGTVGAGAPPPTIPSYS